MISEEHKKYMGEMINKYNILDSCLKEYEVNIGYNIKEKYLRM